VRRERDTGDLFGIEHGDVARRLPEVGGVHDQQVRRRELLDRAGTIFRRGVAEEDLENRLKSEGLQPSASLKIVRNQKSSGVIAAEFGADGEQRDALGAFKPFLQQEPQARWPGRRRVAPGRAGRRGHGR